MANIKESRNGSLAKNGKLNEVIRYLNGLLNMTVREGSNAETPRLISAENHSILITTQADTELPFTVSLNPDGTITVLGGYFIADTATQVSSVTLTAVYIYLRIEHVSAGVLAATPFTIHGSGTALPEIDLDSGTFVKYANYLIAEIVSDEVRQYRSGNAELVLAFTNAKFHYSPILSGGKT